MRKPLYKLVCLIAVLLHLGTHIDTASAAYGQSIAESESLEEDDSPAACEDARHACGCAGVDEPRISGHALPQFSEDHGSPLPEFSAPPLRPPSV